MTALLTNLMCLALAAAPDYQKLADDAKWEWKDDQATAAYSAKNLPADYKVDIAKKPDGFGVVLKFKNKDDKEILSIDGHTGTVFVVKDNILYYADYSGIATGCSLIAVDLTNGKKLWKTPLKGLGPIDHTKYRNAVALELVEGALRVLGNEAAGKYIEFVDPATGKTVGHKMFVKGK